MPSDLCLVKVQWYRSNACAILRVRSQTDKTLIFSNTFPFVHPRPSTSIVYVRHTTNLRAANLLQSSLPLCRPSSQQQQQYRIEQNANFFQHLLTKKKTSNPTFSLPQEQTRMTEGFIYTYNSISHNTKRVVIQLQTSINLVHL